MLLYVFVIITEILKVSYFLSPCSCVFMFLGFYDLGPILKVFHQLGYFEMILFTDQYVGSPLALILIPALCIHWLHLPFKRPQVGGFCFVYTNVAFSNGLITSLFKDKAFITVKHRKQQVLETVAGKRSYRLSVKAKAFPTPEVVW